MQLADLGRACTSRPGLKTAQIFSTKALEDTIARWASVSEHMKVPIVTRGVIRAKPEKALSALMHAQEYSKDEPQERLVFSDGWV